MSVNDAIIAAYRVSLSAARFIPGDIPSLLRHAFSRHFKQNMPAVQRKEAETPPSSVTDVAELLAMLISIPSLEPTAQVLLDCARSILTSGPRLSMNVELADGEALPVALHTLLQGTLFAVLVHGGADPDLERTVEKAERQRVGYSQEDKLPWFLCKKFAFVHHVAAKDGQTFQQKASTTHYAHVLYTGHLFKRDITSLRLTMARMPRIIALHYSCDEAFIAQTPKGLWCWSAAYIGGLGLSGVSTGEAVDPTRLEFASCPAVAAYELSLPAWHKDRVAVRIVIDYMAIRTVIQTPVGLMATGKDADGLVPAGSADCSFQPVILPTGFVPECIMSTEWAVFLSMGDRTMVGGENSYGRLGLGHAEPLSACVELPYRLDKLIISRYHYSIFQSAGKLMLAGKCPESIINAKILPCSPADYYSPVQLDIPAPICSFWCEWDIVVWTDSRRTHSWTRLGGRVTLPFVADACHYLGSLYRASDGQWWEVGASGLGRGQEPEGGVGPLVELV
ncbi:hypothetical protein J8273_4772 [Carpediemonas membranifera]|uniref:Uncharacterized protein n=1 Tax=Carpediemonas membranifera TaxID=201153 RepID=A0A8J6E1M6_9EUKA|nr:hypothetical protein J8273_4772 [Carpediemonas membranifera]|eukprot:KAG9393653.1 hypothetical protein J8273_4772 [Carpediemonas membranifera]